MIGDLRMKEVVRIPIEIPGKRVKALTSSYSIAREVKFSWKEFKVEESWISRAAKIFAKEGQITKQQEQSII